MYVVVMHVCMYVVVTRVVTRMVLVWDDGTNHAFRGGSFLNDMFECAMGRRPYLNIIPRPWIPQANMRLCFFL